MKIPIEEFVSLSHTFYQDPDLSMVTLFENICLIIYNAASNVISVDALKDCEMTFSFQQPLNLS